ncbi:MAG: hypothetical protein ACE5LC_04785 [Candidatus Aminicenantales bacterium]
MLVQYSWENVKSFFIEQIKEFHDYSYNNLGGGCLDHVSAIK